MNVAIIIFILKAYVKCHIPTGSQKQCQLLGDVVPTQPHRTQRQMEGGMGTKRWEEGRRGDNKKSEWRDMGGREKE